MSQEPGEVRVELQPDGAELEFGDVKCIGGDPGIEGEFRQDGSYGGIARTATLALGSRLTVRRPAAHKVRAFFRSIS